MLENNCLHNNIIYSLKNTEVYIAVLSSTLGHLFVGKACSLPNLLPDRVYEARLQVACVRPQLSAGGGTWTRSKSPDVEMDFYNTPRKINIEPENDGLEDEFPFPGVYSQVPAVNLLGCIKRAHLNLEG